MSMSVEGMDDLIRTMEDLGDVGKKAGKKAIRSGAEVILKQAKKDAAKSHGQSLAPSPSKGHAADHLDILYVKAKGNDVYSATGIGSKNDTKALYFQHYGYDDYGLNFKGKPYITKNTGWITRTQEKVGDKAESKVIQALEQEINKIW